MPRRHQYLDVYCCLSHEYLHAYPQPRLTHSNKRTKDQYANVVYPSKRRSMKKETFDEFDLNNDQMNSSIQRADGDKRMKNIIDNLLEQFGQQHRSKNNIQSKISSSSPNQRQYPFMSSPLVKQSKRNHVQTNSSQSHSSTIEINQLNSPVISAHSLETSMENDENRLHFSEQILENNSLMNISIVEPPSIPTIEIVSPAVVPSTLLNNIISSLFPTVSSSENRPMFQQQPKQVRSLSESIEELCLLIRQLLHFELTEQNITPLQATIANRLALLLTYFVAPNPQTSTMERMTSTEEEKPRLLTIGTQTDLEKDTYPIDIHQEITELISTSGKNNTNEIFNF